MLLYAKSYTPKNMIIHIASDHGGFALKKRLTSLISGMGYEVEDHGNSTYDENDDTRMHFKYFYWQKKKNSSRVNNLF